MQFKGLGAPQQAFCRAKFAFAERSAAMKAPVGLLSDRTVCDSRWRGLAPTSSQMYIRLPCLQALWILSTCFPDLKIILQSGPSVFKFNLKRTVIFLHKNFRVCNRSKQGELVPTHKFWIRFFKSDFKNDCWASPKPDIQYKIAPTAYLNRCWISNFFEKNSFRKNQRCFIQYHIKPELLLPFLNVKSRRNASWKFLLHCDMLSTSHHRTLKITWPSARDTRR